MTAAGKSVFACWLKYQWHSAASRKKRKGVSCKVSCDFSEVYKAQTGERHATVYREVQGQAVRSDFWI
jgi:hypothetical protein